jgi:hypothetical protein
MHSALMRAGRVDAHQYILDKGARHFWLHCGITMSYWVALWHHGCVLARIRLTRTAAERGPVLSGACGQVNGFQTLVVQVPSVFEPPQ